MTILHAEFPDSTSITKATYFERTETLRIVFKSGQTYDYFDVPRATFNDLVSVKDQGFSGGAYFYKHIRSAFKCEKYVNRAVAALDEDRGF